MGNMTLKEVEKTLGVTRRAVQGYEKAGIVEASGKTERGYLLYDEYMQKRIGRIKLYQQFGFSIREIKWLIDAPNEMIKIKLENQAERLKEEKAQKETLIEEIYKLIETL